MKRNYMKELMSQGHGDIKAGETGHSRNKTRVEELKLLMRLTAGIVVKLRKS